MQWVKKLHKVSFRFWDFNSIINTGCSLTDQHVLSPSNPKYNDWFFQIYEDLNNHSEIRNTQILQVLNFRTVCKNCCKSDKINGHVWLNWWHNMLIWQRITCAKKEYIIKCMQLENIFNPIVDDAHSSQSSINFSRCNIMTPWLHFSKYISHLSEAKVKYFIIQNSNLSVAHE